MIKIDGDFYSAMLLTDQPCGTLLLKLTENCKDCECYHFLEWYCWSSATQTGAWNRRSKHSCVLIYLGAWIEETMWPLSIVHCLWLRPQLGRIPVANVGMEWVSSWSWRSCQSTEVTSGGRVGGVGLQAEHAPLPLLPKQAIKTWL